MTNFKRLAVVGFGLVGKRHADVIAKLPKLELAAVVEPNEAVKQDVLDLGAQWFSSLEEMFAQSDIDGVVIATPTPLHVSQSLLCIEHKCPILVEKPIAVSADDAQTMVDAAEQAKIPMLVGHHRRYNGMIQAAKNAIDTDMLGEIRSINATCWFYKPDRYFDEAPWRKQKGAGPISVNLVHDVDLMRHFCGDVVQVQAQARPSIRGYDNEDIAAALLTFESGAIGTVTVSDSIVSPWSWELTAKENPIYSRTNESCYMIGGSKGALSVPDLRVWQHQDGPDWWSPISATSLTADSEDPLAKQIKHFCNVIDGKEQPLVSGLEGMLSLEVVEAIQKSAELGTTVAIKSAKAKIALAV